jgi:hypothetical protein
MPGCGRGHFSEGQVYADTESRGGLAELDGLLEGLPPGQECSAAQASLHEASKDSPIDPCSVAHIVGIDDEFARHGLESDLKGGLFF